MHFCTVLWWSYLLQMRTTKSGLCSWGLPFRTGKHQHRGGLVEDSWWGIRVSEWLSRESQWAGGNGVRNRPVWGSLNWNVGIWMRREVFRWQDPAQIAQICCTICSAPLSPASPFDAVLVPLWPFSHAVEEQGSRNSCLVGAEEKYKNRSSGVCSITFGLRIEPPNYSSVRPAVNGWIVSFCEWGRLLGGL